MKVPGSSANLGPAYDAMGLALGVYDEVEVEVVAGGPTVTLDVEGVGAAALPRDETHLVVRALRAALDRVGAEQPSLRLRCRNGVPHGRGLGSSAAAAVTGVLAARVLLADAAALDDQVALEVATALEGHPDNASASLLGGVTLGWMDDGTPHAIRVEPAQALDVVVAVPDTTLATVKARRMIPTEIPHEDATFNVGRAALLVEAVSRRPDLLLPATADRMHQNYRAEAMPDSARLIADLRAAGLAATVSGAGPSVLVQGSGAGLLARVEDAAGGRPGWTFLAPGIDRDGGVTTVLD